MTDQRAPTELERRLYHDLARALQWIQNVNEEIGDMRLLDHCPNNWGGRAAMIETLKAAEQEHPDMAELLPGTFVTDGTTRGYIVGAGTIGTCKRLIPAYRVDVGGGRETLILTQYARRV